MIAADLIRPAESARYFRFRHPIVRRAVYDSTPRAWQLGAHERTAQALAGIHRPASVFAHHVERSARLGDEDAIAVLVEGAHEVAPHAPLTAGNWLLAALRLLPPNADDGRRLTLLDEATSALASAGAYEASIGALEQSLALLSHDDSVARAELIVKIANAKRRTGGPLESRELLVKTLESLDGSNNVAVPPLLVEIAFNDYWRGEFAEARTFANAVLVGNGVDQLTTFVAAMLSSLSNCSEGRVIEALADLDEAQTALARLPDERLVETIDLIQGIASAALRLEHPDDTLDHLRRGFVLARASGQGTMIPGWLAFEAFALLMKGRVADALKISETAVDAALLSGSAWHTAYAFEADSLAAFWAGDTERALASAQEALASAERIPATLPRSRARVQLAGAWYAAGDPQRAAAELDCARHRSDPTRPRSARGARLGARGAGPARARRSRHRARPLRPRSTSGRTPRRCSNNKRSRGAAVRRAAGERRRRPARSAVIDAAADIAARVDNPFLRARIRALHGVCLAAVGRSVPSDRRARNRRDRCCSSAVRPRSRRRGARAPAPRSPRHSPDPAPRAGYRARGAEPA